MPEYDKRAVAGICEWKTPNRTWLDHAMGAVDGPLSKATDWVLERGKIGEAIRNTVAGLVGLCNDAAQWSVRRDAIYEEFREAGHVVAEPNDLAQLRLEDIDKVVGFLGAKYKSVAAAEGAATGVAGLPGILVDLPTLVTLNLRAIGEYATYYGFDVTLQQERLFAMHVLGLASSPKDAAKQVALAELALIARNVAMKKTWATLEEHAFVQVVQQIARAVGIRLTKAKLAQVVPVVGAAVGSGYNAYYTAGVCNAAYHLYRERFLAGRYCPDADASRVTVEQKPQKPPPDADATGVTVQPQPPPDAGGGRYEETDQDMP